MFPPKPSILTALSLVVGLSFVAASANAAELRLRCEQRGSPARSKISVDGKNLFPQNAMYSTRIVSGSHQATHAPMTATADEVEFDFDSNPADIAAGAQAIAGDFIVGGSVQAAIFDANGQVVAGPVVATCRSRTPIQVRSPSAAPTPTVDPRAGRLSERAPSERIRR